ARPDPLAIAPGPLPFRRRVGAAEFRQMDDARRHPSPVSDRNRDRETLLAREEGAGAVERIDDEGPLRLEPRRAVLGFLGQPAVIGPGGAQFGPQHPVDLEIGLGDRARAAALLPGLRPLPEIPERDPARSLGGLDQQREVTRRQSSAPRPAGSAPPG